MTPKRKKVESFILDKISAITGGDKHNIDLYKNMFKAMTDDDFDVFMGRLKNGEFSLQVIVPNGGGVELSVERNMKIMESMGRSFFHRVIYGATGSKRDGTYRAPYMTKNKYLVYDLPWRRTSQLLYKGISVPKDNHTIDLLSGQVTGESKAAKLSLPEMQVLLGLGLEDTITELLKIRGGDLGASRAMEASVMRTGGVSQKSIEPFSTTVVSSKTLKTMLFSAHLKNTL